MKTTEIARIETVEQYVESTQYGDLDVKARKVESVVRWNEGRYAGLLELRVDFWRNGIKLPGYSDGNPDAVAAVLARA